MGKLNLSGQTYEYLTVLREKGKNKHGQTLWECKCFCEAIVDVVGSALRSGHTKSCGCQSRRLTTEANIKHGMSSRKGNTPTYNTWKRMVQRCTNPNSKEYPNYGGRGITICERWLKFEKFLADMGERPENASIDRIDNSQGYYPDNCRWSTRSEQQRNRRNNRLITFNGKTQCLEDWAAEIGIRSDVLIKRLKLGWSIEETLTKPLDSRYQRLKK